METRYLEVTFRNGRPFAAYLYLTSHRQGRSSRTQRMKGGILVDFDADDQPLGVEITNAETVTIESVNAALKSLGLPQLDADEVKPLKAA